MCGCRLEAASPESLRVHKASQTRPIDESKARETRGKSKCKSQNNAKTRTKLFPQTAVILKLYELKREREREKLFWVELNRPPKLLKNGEFAFRLTAERSMKCVKLRMQINSHQFP